MPLGGSLAGMARVVLRADTAGYTRDMQSAERTFRNTTNDMNRHVSALSRGALAGSGIFHGFARSIAFASGAFLGGAGLTFAIKSAISSASDLNEQMNKATVVFRGQEKDILAWSKTTTDSFFISQRAALSYAGTFGQLLQPMGFTILQSEQMSKQFVQLAADMASFSNASPEDALEALRSGLVGENEPLRRFGVQISDVRARQELTAAGAKNLGATLTAQQRAWAAYRIILKDTALAHGDAQRTSGGLANQQRQLKARVDELMAGLGKQLLPAVTQLVRRLNEWLSNAENVARIQHGLSEAIKIVGETVRWLANEWDRYQKGLKTIRDTYAAIKEWGENLDRWMKRFGLNLVLRIVEPFSHLPGKLGGWARRAKTRIQEELVDLGIQERWGKIGDESGEAYYNALLPWTQQAAAAAANAAAGATTTKAGKGKGGATGGGMGQLSPLQASVVTTAVRLGPQSGKRYVWGGGRAGSPGTPQVGYDCSGYLYDIYRRNGITIPGTSQSQFADPNALSVGLDELLPGDGVFFDNGVGAQPGHVGIVISGSGRSAVMIDYFTRGQQAERKRVVDKGLPFMGGRRWIKVKSGSKGGTGGKGDTGGTYDTTAAGDLPLGDGTKKPPKEQPLVPARLRLAVSEAELTKGNADDIRALRAIEDYLEQRIRVEKNIEKRIELIDELGATRSKIVGLGAKKAPAADDLIPLPLQLRQAKAELTRTTADDLAVLTDIENYLEKRIAKEKNIRKRVEETQALAAIRGQIKALQPAAKPEKPIGLGIPGLAGVLGEFEQLRGGVSPISITVDGLGKILYPGAPTLGSWDRVIDLLKKKLKAALARQAVLQRNLRTAQRAKRPNKKHIANIRQALQKVNQVVGELRSDIGEALAARNDLAAEISSDIQRQAEENEQARERADQEAADLARGAAEEQARAAEASAAQAEEQARTQAAAAEQAAQAQVQAAAAYEAGLLEAPADLRLALARAQGTPDTADDLGILQSMRSLFASRVAMTQNIETQISLQNELNSLDSQIANLMQQRVDGVDAELKRQQDIDRQVVAYLSAQRELVRSYGQTLIRGSMAGSPISVQNYFASGPQDPHLYSANIAFELRALVG